MVTPRRDWAVLRLIVAQQAKCLDILVLGRVGQGCEDGIWGVDAFREMI